jgi:ubiquinone/menaquinone biosynthesis C-methylase UbiE
MDVNKIMELFNSNAEKYDSQRRSLIPCFDDFYIRSVSMLKTYKDNFLNIVDLGAGTGILTKVIYEMYPNANYTLIDISKDMLNIAKERFTGIDNCNFLETNYIESIPVNNCDLICSSLSIHHLDEIDKDKLYKNIYLKLDKSGCFINLDLFNAKSEIINNLYNTWWLEYIKNSGFFEEKKEELWLESRELDKENTIDETIKLLERNGFKKIRLIKDYISKNCEKDNRFIKREGYKELMDFVINKI